MKKELLIGICLLHGLIIFGQQNEIPQSFSFLSKVELKTDFFSETFENPSVYCDTTISEIINRMVNEESIFYEEFVGEVGLHEFVITQIDRKSKQKYYVLFDYGMSADPSFSIVQSTEDGYKDIGRIGGLTLFIPGNGFLYSMGHTNNYFSKRKKFQIIDGELIEIEQPMYYVGIKTKTKGLLNLYSDKSMNRPVATLPEGAEIEILLNDKNFYLIRTSFGLVGWWQLRDFRSEIIEEIFFKGD